MAIQMRRGLKKDFDQNKMLPGEWAVSIDSVTSNQIVWMCFAAGVCKRMGTYEDFQSMIAEIAGEIKADYVLEFNAIKAEIQSVANTAISAKNEVLIVKSDITNTYLPQIQQYVSDAQMAASTATSKANSASESAVLSESYAVGGTGTRNGEDTDNAKYYADEAKKSAEKAVEIVGGDFLAKTGDASNTTVSFTKASTRSNIVSGEKQSTIFGKIMKWFADMTAAAFAQMISSYSDLMSNTVSGYIPDAKAVKDGFDSVKSDLIELMPTTTTLFSGSVTDWALTNYLTIDLTESMINQINKGNQFIIFTFGGGTQVIGGSYGQPRVIGYVPSVSEWVGGCSIIEGKIAYWCKVDNQLHVWCNENPKLALREIQLRKNI